MKKSDDYIIRSVKDLLDSCHLAVLATSSESFPYTSLVGFTYSADLKEIYFATFENTNKFRNLSENPRVSLLADSRENSASDLEKAKALTILGKAEAARGPESSRLKELYLRRFPHLKDFIGDPACAMIKVAAEKYILVERFQEVMELEVKR